MPLLKITLTIIIVVIILLFVLVFLLFGTNFFSLQLNRITIDEAINLAKNCQIKEVGEAYRGPAGRIIILLNNSEKFLDNKYINYTLGDNSYPTESYQKFREILNDSERKCGFQVRFVSG